MHNIGFIVMRQFATNIRWSRIIAVLLVINVLLLGGQLVSSLTHIPDPVQTPAPTPSLVDPAQPVKMVVPSPAPAVQASLWWNSEIANRDLFLVQNLHFRWVKQVFPWRDIETSKGQFVWQQADQVVGAAETHGRFILARLGTEPHWARPAGYPAGVHSGPPDNYQDFEDFCYTVSNRYQGRSIKAYEVWNEPNLAREWGGDPPDPAGYTRLLAACAKGIRRGDPKALVISAGLAPTGTGLPVAMPDDQFFRGMYKAGAAQYFDMLGVNAPGYAAPPQASPDEVEKHPEWGGHRWACFRHVEDIRRIMLEYGDGQKQIAVTEMGWTLDKTHPDYSWFAVTEDQQGEYLAGAYWWARLNWQPWIGIMATIYLADPQWTPDNEQYWWAITVPGYPQPAIRQAYRDLRGLPDWSHGFYDTWGR